MNFLASTQAKPELVGDQGNTLESDVSGIINGVISVLGIVAVVAIILGGIQFLTANGDPGKVKKGKDIILYGIIGLVVVLISAAIVNFVIAKAA